VTFALRSEYVTHKERIIIGGTPTSDEFVTFASIKNAKRHANVTRTNRWFDRNEFVKVVRDEFVTFVRITNSKWHANVTRTDMGWLCLVGSINL